MKKYTYLAALACAAFLSVQCSESRLDTDFEAEEEGTVVPEFFATTVSTRLNVNMEGITSWDKDDQLDIFINSTLNKARPGRKQWNKLTFRIDPGQFLQGHFLPPANVPKLVADKHYNWYAVNHQVKNLHNKIQTLTWDDQISDGTTAHISKAEHLWGKAEGVIGKETPTITLMHLGALMKFNIINGSDKPMSLESVRLGTPSGVYLAGNFSIDLEKGTLSPKAKECRTSILLGLSKRPVLAPGEAYEISLLVPPFSLKAGTAFTVTVNTADKRHSENKYTMKRDIQFQSGTINTADVFVKLSSQPENPSYDPTDIPIADPAFRDAIFNFGWSPDGNIDADGDGKISQAEADKITMIDIQQEQGIVSLQGLEHLRGLINLRIHNQSGLEEIDVSGMKGHLNELECDGNPILKTIWAWDDLNSVYEMQGWAYAPTVKIRRHTDNKEFIRGDYLGKADTWI